VNGVDEIELNMQRLRVAGGSLGVHIEVLDHRYHLVANGYGELDLTLPTGIYTVRYRAANAHAERRVVLLPDRPQELPDPPDLPFASPVPFGLSAEDMLHGEHARQISLELTAEYGQGSQLLIFVRDVESEGAHPAVLGLTLHRPGGADRSGEFELDLASLMRPQKGAASSGVNLALDPGCYILRMQVTDGQSIEVALHLAKGWQHQVFLLRRGGNLQEAGEALPDLSGAAHLAAPLGIGFELSERRGDRLDLTGRAQLMELARFALAQGRPDMSAEHTMKILQTERLDPLLGIVGLHMLLSQVGLHPERTPADDAGLTFAQRTVDQLTNEICGDAGNSDFAILRTEIGMRQGVPVEPVPIENPPLLQRSWDMLVKHTAKWPHVVRQKSLCDRIATRQWGGGTWLIWETPEAAIAEAAHESTAGSRSQRVRTKKRPDPRPVGVVAVGAPLLQWCISEFPAYLSDIDVAEAIKRLKHWPRMPDARLASDVLPLLVQELDGRLDEMTDGLSLARLVDGPDLGEAERALLLYLIGRLSLHARRPDVRAEATTLGDLVMRLRLPAIHVAAAVIGLAATLAWDVLRELQKLELRERKNARRRPTSDNVLSDDMATSKRQLEERFAHGAYV
jgi:hypothetical protein